MKSTRAHIMIIMILSITIVAVLSFLPSLELSQPEELVIQTVNEANIVDLIAAIPVQTRIRKVVLNHSILSIDLNVMNKQPSTAVYQDLFQIALHTINGTQNINQVLIRIFDTGTGANNARPRSSLLLSTHLKREKLGNLKELTIDKTPNFYRKLLEAKSQMTYTSRWSERFPAEDT